MSGGERKRGRFLINPVYHHCTLWEDWKNGMFRVVSKQGDDFLLKESILLLCDRNKLYEAMKNVINNWIISTEENFTKIDTNRRAWLGQAACCLNHNAPDIITRKAWGMISEDQRNEANLIAEKVILEWEIEYTKQESERCQQLNLWE